MPRLENVVNAMNKRPPEPTPGEKMTLAAGNSITRAAETIEKMMDRVMEPAITPNDFNRAVQQLGSGIKSLAKLLKKVETNVNGEVSKRPTDFAPVLEAISLLDKNVQGLTGAISSIKLPDVNIPPVPETDLKPILDEVWDAKRILQNLKIEAPAIPVLPEQKGRSFTFDIKRNNAGYIKSIDCKECYE